MIPLNKPTSATFPLESLYMLSQTTRAIGVGFIVLGIILSGRLGVPSVLQAQALHGGPMKLDPDPNRQILLRILCRQSECSFSTSETRRSSL